MVEILEMLDVAKIPLKILSPGMNQQSKINGRNIGNYSKQRRYFHLYVRNQTIKSNGMNIENNEYCKDSKNQQHQSNGG